MDPAFNPWLEPKKSSRETHRKPLKGSSKELYVELDHLLDGKDSFLGPTPTPTLPSASSEPTGPKGAKRKKNSAEVSMPPKDPISSTDPTEVVSSSSSKKSKRQEVKPVLLPTTQVITSTFPLISYNTPLISFSRSWWKWPSPDRTWTTTSSCTSNKWSRLNSA
jgi:hypothetical protein